MRTRWKEETWIRNIDLAIASSPHLITCAFFRNSRSVKLSAHSDPWSNYYVLSLMRQQAYLAQLYMCTCTDSYRDWRSYFRTGYSRPRCLSIHIQLGPNDQLLGYGVFEISDRMDTRRARHLPGSYVDRAREKDTAGRRFEPVTDETRKAIGPARLLLNRKFRTRRYITLPGKYVAATASILSNRCMYFQLFLHDML